MGIKSSYHFQLCQFAKLDSEGTLIGVHDSELDAEGASVGGHDSKMAFRCSYHL